MTEAANCLTPAAPASGSTRSSVGGWTYMDVTLANLSDLLLGPIAWINPRINLTCAYAEIECLFSNLLPPPVLDEIVRAHRLHARGPVETPADGHTSGLFGVDVAIREAAHTCGCYDEVAALQATAHRVRRDGRASVDIDALTVAVTTAATFVSRLPRLSYNLRCACTASLTYRLHDALRACPPCKLTLACAACAHDTIWFVPSPRHRG